MLREGVTRTNPVDTHAMAAVCGVVGRLAVMALVFVSVTAGGLYTY